MKKNVRMYLGLAIAVVAMVLGMGTGAAAADTVLVNPASCLPLWPW